MLLYVVERDYTCLFRVVAEATISKQCLKVGVLAEVLAYA